MRNKNATQSSMTFGLRSCAKWIVTAHILNFKTGQRRLVGFTFRSSVSATERPLGIRLDLIPHRVYVWFLRSVQSTVMISDKIVVLEFIVRCYLNIRKLLEVNEIKIYFVHIS